MGEFCKGRHVCCNANDQNGMIYCLNEYLCRLRQMEAKSHYGKYCGVPEFMKTKQPRYEENKDAVPLITSVPVMEFRVTYDKNKIKENKDHPNLTYILIEDSPAEIEKVPATCQCCNFRCYSFYPQTKQSPSSYNICFPCYYYCYPYNQNVSQPQHTCVFKQFHQCQPVRMQSSPQYCVPTWTQQPCFHWGDGSVPVCPPGQDGNLATAQSEANCQTPICRDRGQDVNRSDVNRQETQECNDIQPSDNAPIRPVSAKYVENPSSKKIFLRDIINSDIQSDQQLKVTNKERPVTPKSVVKVNQANKVHVYTALVTLDNPAEGAAFLPIPPIEEPKEEPKEESKEAPKEESKEAPKEESIEVPNEEYKEKSKMEPKTEPKEEPKAEIKTEPERAIRPYKRYRLRAPYMYDISDTELFPD